MTTQTAISNYDDIIDSRDVIERIDQLTEEVTTCPHCGDFILDGENPLIPETRCTECEQPYDLDEERTELKELKALAEEASGYCEDWQYGAALIRDSYFTEYAIEMLQDCGDLPAEIPFYIVIDEEATARNIQMDYTSVDFEGVDYWIR